MKNGMSTLNLPSSYILWGISESWLQIPHDRIFVAFRLSSSEGAYRNQVARLRELSESGSPNFGKFGYINPTTFPHGEFLKLGKI